MFESEADFLNLDIHYNVARSYDYVRKKVKEDGHMNCYNFQLEQTSWPASQSRGRCEVQLVSGVLRSNEWLYGPASLAVDRSVILPCEHYKCLIPCPCIFCRCPNYSSCPTSCDGSCACERCQCEFEQHSKYHKKAPHSNCKFCKQLLVCFPAFNFVMNDVKFNLYCSRLLKRTNFVHRFSGSKSRCVKCDRCDTEFSSEENLIRHFKSHHAKIKHLCQVCDVSFTQKASLDRHMKLAHSEEEITLFKCDLCN